MTERATAMPPTPRARLVIGGTVLVVGFLCPLLVPVVAGSDLPTGWKTGLSGLLLFGIPEIFMLIAVAIMGKAGFDAIMNPVKRVFKKFMAEYGPPDHVSKRRYRVGLVMFTVPLVLAAIEPYFGHHLPWHEEARFVYVIGGDVLLVSSLFVLGGDFWDKLRALFVHDAKAHS